MNSPTKIKVTMTLILWQRKLYPKGHSILDQVLLARLRCQNALHMLRSQ
jgi:hypothetical protein